VSFNDIAYSLISGIFTVLSGNVIYGGVSYPVYKSIPKVPATTYVWVGNVIQREEGTKGEFIYTGTVQVQVIDESKERADMKLAQGIMNVCRGLLKPTKGSTFPIGITHALIVFAHESFNPMVFQSPNGVTQVRLVDMYEFIAQDYTAPVVYPLLDYDGNVYNTGTIGSQEWIVENLKVTHYSDGSDIQYLGAITAVELGWDWIGDAGWDNFVIGATDMGNTEISLASNAVGLATASNILTPFALTAGDKIKIYIRVIVNSGILPNLKFLWDPGVEEHPLAWVDGDNVFEFTIANTGTHYLQITCPGNSDFYAEFDVYKNPSWREDTIGAYCYYMNDPTFKSWGLLYNYYAGVNAHNLAYFTRGGVQEVGWRVPSDMDWFILYTTLGGPTSGGPLKETGLVHWDFPNAGATDLYGWKGYGSGNRYIDLTDPLTEGFSNIGVYADFWSTDEAFDPDEGFAIWLSNTDDIFYQAAWHKFCGMNVRCVRDI
jgi:uncharacterized protein (TIGR02145 family)